MSLVSTVQTSALAMTPVQDSGEMPQQRDDLDLCVPDCAAVVQNTGLQFVQKLG